MNTWTPVWSKLPDSSIWLESKEVRILFTTMLAIKDKDHVIRYSAFELSRKANLTEQEVMDSLKVMENPDTKRLEPQEFEGRRIKKVEDGWLMLNGEKYRMKVRESYRKEYNRIKQAEYRNNPNPEEPEPANGQLEIPSELNFPVFIAAWQKWISFRKGLGKKPKDWYAMFSEQLEWLKSFGAAEAVEIINSSIRNGWQGLFERKHDKSIGSSTGQRPVIDRNAGTLNAGRSKDYANVGKLLPVPNPERPPVGTDGTGSHEI